MFEELFTVIQDRQQNPLPGSYTASLYAQGQEKISKKIMEEATEVVVAAQGGHYASVARGRDRFWVFPLDALGWSYVVDASVDELIHP